MDVIEELTEHQDRIDRAHVQRRVVDWRERVAGLYDVLESWLPAGWSALRRFDVEMDEPIMRSVGVPKERLPSLVLRHGACSVRLEPRALWIMGANGRVDMVSSAGHAVIVDLADLYEPARWTIAPFRDQLDQRSLTRESFVGSLS